jgi:hypothetical protein
VSRDGGEGEQDHEGGDVSLGRSHRSGVPAAR